MSSDLIKKILKGYWDSTKNFGTALFFIATAALVSIAVIFPLWFLATNYPRIYTWVIEAIILLSVIFWIGIKVLTKSNKTSQVSKKITARRFFVKAAKALAVIVMIYITIKLFGSGQFLIGGLSLLIFVFLSGWIFYGSKPAKGRV